jgi:hypothetical protein
LRIWAWRTERRAWLWSRRIRKLFATPLPGNCSSSVAPYYASESLSNTSLFFQGLLWRSGLQVQLIYINHLVLNSSLAR